MIVGLEGLLFAVLGGNGAGVFGLLKIATVFGFVDEFITAVVWTAFVFVLASNDIAGLDMVQF